METNKETKAKGAFVPLGAELFERFVTRYKATGDEYIVLARRGVWWIMANLKSKKLQPVKSLKYGYEFVRLAHTSEKGSFLIQYENKPEKFLVLEASGPWWTLVNIENGKYESVQTLGGYFLVGFPKRAD